MAEIIMIDAENSCVGWYRDCVRVMWCESVCCAVQEASASLEAAFPSRKGRTVTGASE